MCPVCDKPCAAEHLNDGLRLCVTTGFAYTLDGGRVLLVETNRTSPPQKPVGERVTFNPVRTKSAS